MARYRDLEVIDTDVQQTMSRVLQHWFMSKTHRYENDFYEWIPASATSSATGQGWILTIVDTDTDGGASQAIEDTAGGVLALTVDDNALDRVNLQLNAETFQLASGKPLFFETRFAVNCAAIANPTVIVGLCIKDTDLTGGMSDGAYFIKDNGDANLDFCCEKDSNESKADTGVDMADNTFITPAFYFDGAGNVTYYVNGTEIGTTSTYVPDDEALTVSFSQLNGEANANIFRIDYVKAIQVR